ncbi:MAG: hypothetical protein JSR46_03320, partial [Verrucomicrobia bacterium]|nr:hypothetical protein [Verrucomicrobiota bacterium]
MGTIISATLYNNNDELARERSFNVYNGNQTFFNKGKTDIEGKFTITLPAPASPDKVTLLFTLTKNNNILSTLFAKAGNVEKNFVAEKREFEIEEGSVETVLDKPIVNLGRVDMTTAYDKEIPPLKYLLNVAKTALPPKIKEAGSKLLRNTLQEIQESFGIKRVESSIKNIWNFFRRGLCPTYFKKEKNGNLSTEFHWSSHKFDREDSLTDFCKAFFTKAG